MAFYSSVRDEDLARFNNEYNISLNPFALSAYTVLLQIGRTYLDTVVEAFFDRADKISLKLQIAEQYAMSDNCNAGITDNVQSIPMAKGFNFKNVIELQAADFAAWELRYYHLGLDEFFESDNLPTDQNERGKLLNEFINARQHRDNARQHRGSFDNLLSKSANQGGIWDYQTLCRVHEARGGSWDVD
jgi:hypothetical protein